MQYGNFKISSKVFRHSSDIGGLPPQGGANANYRVSILPLFPPLSKWFSE